MNKISRLSPLLALLSHYKYVITVVVGVLLVGFVDDNSFMQRAKLELQIARERYFMKADDEDIFVLSDDETPKTLENETTE